MELSDYTKMKTYFIAQKRINILISFLGMILNSSLYVCISFWCMLSGVCFLLYAYLTEQARESELESGTSLIVHMFSCLYPSVHFILQIHMVFLSPTAYLLMEILSVCDSVTDNFQPCDWSDCPKACL
jgi:hypothetical protein